MTNLDINGIKCDECGFRFKREFVSEIEEITDEGELIIHHVCEYCQWENIV